MKRKGIIGMVGPEAQPAAVASGLQLGSFVSSVDEQRVLGAVSWSEGGIRHRPWPEAGAGLELLAGPGVEYWLGDGPVLYGSEGELCWGSDGRYAFVVIQLPSEKVAMAELARFAYDQLLCKLEEIGCPHLIRCWNSVPHINKGGGDNELYRQFCLGRLRAFDASNLSKDEYPPASAVGSDTDWLTIICVAGSSPIKNICNARQVNAYEYPQEYGPASPSFSRAGLLVDGGKRMLLVSGTASIVGHSSMHSDSLAQQIRETLENLLGITTRISPDVAPACVRAYLRNAADAGSVTTAIQNAYPGTEICLLRSDICRRELLVEVEGVWLY